MPTRRTLLICGLALPALAALGVAGPARADDSDQAVAFITKLGTDLIGVVNGPGPLADKQAALAQIVDRDVDVDGVGQFCLVSFWRIATPDQQRQSLSLFHDVQLRNVTGKIGDYPGVTFSIGRAQPREGAIAVDSIVTRPGNAPNAVQWLVSSASGGPKVIDVIAEGTSLRLTQRSDYLSYLSSHGSQVQALLDAIHRQAQSAGQ